MTSLLRRLVNGRQCVLAALPGHLTPSVVPAWASPAAPMIDGIAASTTTIGGKGLQHDAAYHLALPGANVTMVADGVSGAMRSDYAAQLAVLVALETMHASIAAGGVADAQLLGLAFERAHAEVDQLNAVLKRDLGGRAGTTLLIGVETADAMLVGACGNGAALFAYGDLGWATNPIYPQEHEGGLAEYLGMPGSTVRPMISSFPKSQYTGGVLMLLTDGMYRPQTVMRDAMRALGRIRQKVETTPPGKVIDLQGELETWVREIDTDDNRSVGLLVSASAIRHWQLKESGSQQDA